MFQGTKLNRRAIGHERLQHVGQGRFSQVVLVGGNTNVAQAGNNAYYHHQLNEREALLSVHICSSGLCGATLTAGKKADEGQKMEREAAFREFVLTCREEQRDCEEG